MDHKYPKWSCLITAVMVIYSDLGFTVFVWMCIWVTACNSVCGLIHITHTCPLPTAGPLQLHPETQLRALAGKQARAGGRWDETGSPGSSFPSSSLKAPLQDADGLRCQSKAKAQSVSTQLAACGMWSNPNMSHLSACFALSHACSHRRKQEGLIRPVFHSS